MWTTALELDSCLQRTAGSSTVLRDAVRRGADLQVMSAFYHDEHVDTGSRQHELVEEAMDMRATFLVEDRWCAGAQTLRQPVELPADFGPRPSLSLFLYNEDGGQAIARPYLDGPPAAGPREEAAPLTYPEMPKYREFSRYDDDTNAPSSNFLYHFEYLRFRVNDDYREVLSHDENGVVTGGSMDELAAAFEERHRILLLLYGPAAVHRRHAPDAARAAADAASVPFQQLGLWLVHRAHGWPCRQADLRSVHASAATRDRKICHALVLSQDARRVVAEFAQERQLP